MAQTVTSEYYRKWVKQYDSDDPFVLLMEVAHPSLSEPVRISSDATSFLYLDPESQEPVYGTRSTFGGSEELTFFAFPFAFTLPDQPEGSDSQIKAQLRIDSVSRVYTETIRDIETSPELRMALCFASDPDTLVETLPALLISDISYDVKTITLDLTVDDFRLQTFPALQFYSSFFPGLFT